MKKRMNSKKYLKILVFLVISLLVPTLVLGQGPTFSKLFCVVFSAGSCERALSTGEECFCGSGIDADSGDFCCQAKSQIFDNKEDCETVCEVNIDPDEEDEEDEDETITDCTEDENTKECDPDIHEDNWFKWCSKTTKKCISKCEACGARAASGIEESACSTIPNDKTWECNSAWTTETCKDDPECIAGYCPTGFCSKEDWVKPPTESQCKPGDTTCTEDNDILWNKNNLKCHEGACITKCTFCASGNSADFCGDVKLDWSCAEVPKGDDEIIFPDGKKCGDSGTKCIKNMCENSNLYCVSEEIVDSYGLVKNVLPKILSIADLLVAVEKCDFKVYYTTPEGRKKMLIDDGRTPIFPEPSILEIVSDPICEGLEWEGKTITPEFTWMGEIVSGCKDKECEIDLSHPVYAQYLNFEISVSMEIKLEGDVLKEKFDKEFELLFPKESCDPKQYCWPKSWHGQAGDRFYEIDMPAWGGVLCNDDSKDKTCLQEQTCVCWQRSSKKACKKEQCEEAVSECNCGGDLIFADEEFCNVDAPPDKRVSKDKSACDDTLEISNACKDLDNPCEYKGDGEICLGSVCKLEQKGNIGNTLKVEGVCREITYDDENGETTTNIACVSNVLGYNPCKNNFGGQCITLTDSSISQLLKMKTGEEIGRLTCYPSSKRGGTTPFYRFPSDTSSSQYSAAKADCVKKKGTGGECCIVENMDSLADKSTWHISNLFGPIHPSASYLWHRTGWDQKWKAVFTDGILKFNESDFWSKSTQDWATRGICDAIVGMPKGEAQNVDRARYQEIGNTVIYAGGEYGPEGGLPDGDLYYKGGWSVSSGNPTPDDTGRIKYSVAVWNSTTGDYGIVKYNNNGTLVEVLDFIVEPRDISAGDFAFYYPHSELLFSHVCVGYILNYEEKKDRNGFYSDEVSLHCVPFVLDDGTVNSGYGTPKKDQTSTGGGQSTALGGKRIDI